MSVPSITPTEERLLSGKEKRKSKLSIVLIGVIGLLALGGIGYIGYDKFLADHEVDAVTPPAARNPRTVKDGTSTKPEKAAEPATPKAAKAAGDLKSGPLILEKSKGGSSLVYAVGTIRNESDHQRFGVKVEVDILDASGKPVGKATDYIQVIEPRKEWRFHALVLEDRAASAKIAAIKEDE